MSRSIRTSFRSWFVRPATTAHRRVKVRALAGMLRLEDRIAPAGQIVAAAGPGGGPHVTVYDGTSGSLLLSFFAYDPAFRGGVCAVAADINDDGTPDVITGAGPGGGPHVRAFDGVTARPILDLFAFDPSFRGGVNVAVGDVTGDGRPDIIAAAGPGGGPHVTVYDSTTGDLQVSFFAYDAAFAGGVHVAAADLDGDGTSDIVTGAGAGGGPHVQTFNVSTLSTLRSFMAYDPAFTGGVHVAGADLDGDGLAEIITGAGPGGGPLVRVFDGASGQPNQEGHVFDPAFTGGVTVSTGDTNGDGIPEVLVGAGEGGGPIVRAFGRATGFSTGDIMAFDANFRGGVGVAGTASVIRAARLAGDGAPYSDLTITGNFIAGVPTTVVFDDGAGYRVELPTQEVTSTTVRVSVPPYFNARTGEFGASKVPAAGTAGRTAGVVTVQVNQAPLGAQTSTLNGPVDIAGIPGSIRTNALTMTIQDLPQSDAAPGELTRTFLEVMIEVTDKTIAETQVVSTQAGAPASTAMILQELQLAREQYAGSLADVTKLISGELTEVVVATFANNPVRLTTQSLAIHDRLVAAWAKQLPSSGVVTSFSSSVKGRVSSTIGLSADTDTELQRMINGTVNSLFGGIAEDIKKVTGRLAQANVVATGIAGAIAKIAGLSNPATGLVVAATFFITTYYPALPIVAVKTIGDVARQGVPSPKTLFGLVEPAVAQLHNYVAQMRQRATLQALQFEEEFIDWFEIGQDSYDLFNYDPSPDSWFTGISDWLFPDDNVQFPTSVSVPTQTTYERRYEWCDTCAKSPAP